MAKPKILGISGSLRAGSFNTLTLQEMARLADGKADFAIQSISDIPLYNGDIDSGDGPQSVTILKAAIEGSDALVIATPEYNYSVPGVLKNAIDWVSRPAFNSVLKDKPTAIMSASMAFTGGVRAQAHLKAIFAGTLTSVIPMTETLVGAAHRIFDEQGRLTDERTLRHIEGVLDGVLAYLNG